jgi:hypothetical protein
MILSTLFHVYYHVSLQVFFKLVDVRFGGMANLDRDKYNCELFGYGSNATVYRPGHMSASMANATPTKAQLHAAHTPASHADTSNSNTAVAYAITSNSNGAANLNATFVANGVIAGQFHCLVYFW